MPFLPVAGLLFDEENQRLYPDVQLDIPRQIVEAEQGEIDLYERFSDFFGYGFYIATRTVS